MDQPVHDGHGNVLIDEELAPTGKVLIGGQNDRAVFIQGIDQLEQVVVALFVRNRSNHAVIVSRAQDLI